MTRPAILIVEDELMIRKLLAASLRRTGAEVDTAVDGAEALERMATRDYALVLLDLMLPRVNGFEVLARITTWPRRPMLFVMTAFPPASTMALDSELVHLIVRKPFDLDMLTGVVRDCLGQLLQRPLDEDMPGIAEDAGSRPPC